MTNSRTEVPTVEGVAHTRVPPPLGADQAVDPYDRLPVNAVRPALHPPDDICRFAVAHPRELCKYVRPSAPVTAAELTDVPAPLAQPEPPAPWETA